jgi:hypothetical protein
MDAFWLLLATPFVWPLVAIATGIRAARRRTPGAPPGRPGGATLTLGTAALAIVVVVFGGRLYARIGPYHDLAPLLASATLNAVGLAVAAIATGIAAALRREDALRVRIGLLAATAAVATIAAHALPMLWHLDLRLPRLGELLPVVPAFAWPALALAAAATARHREARRDALALGSLAAAVAAAAVLAVLASRWGRLDVDALVPGGLHVLGLASAALLSAIAALARGARGWPARAALAAALTELALLLVPLGAAVLFMFLFT